MANVGYVRVSSTDQKTDRQLEGVALDEKFEEKASAADTARPQLLLCMAYVRQGDTLHVHSIDRLARNLQDLLRLLEQLMDKGVTVQFHKEHLTFSGQDDPFQRLQLQIIGAVAEFERALIKERQREGIAKAKSMGKHLGRERKLTPELERTIKTRADAGEEKKALASEFGVSRQTLYRILSREPKNRN
ncbi:MAG: recombinase family protein [Proteobacteria bacterium]|nr:recombinase family protein [Pseudomonadota bacterium]MBU1595469.1 recombinase family protein [Pseudomonadota bacterium]